MGEEYPQEQPQQHDTEDLGQKQQIDVQSESSEATQSQPQQDEHWDHQKAETIAYAADDELKDKRYKREEYERIVGDMGFHKSKLEDGLLLSAGYHEAEIGRHEIYKRSFHEELTAPFEVLYNVNPDLFAHMPTSEFMKLAAEYNLLVGCGEYIEEAQKKFLYLEEFCKEALEAKTFVTPYRNFDISRELVDYAQHIYTSRSSFTDEERSAFLEELEELNDSVELSSDQQFEMSIKQKLEHWLPLIKKYEAIVEVELKKAQAQAQDHLDKHKPQPSAA